MNKNLKSIVSVLTIMTLLFSSATACSQINKIKASKNYITKDVNVSDFNAIKLLGSSDIVYSQSKDGKTKVQIYGSDNVVELLDVKVVNNTLHVQFKKNTNISFNNDGRLKVIVSSPNLNAVTLQGSGDIVLNSDINTQDLAISLSGSGDIKSEGNIFSSNLKVQLAGSGDINFKKGIQATTSILSLNGSGDLKTTNITSASGSVSLNGSGDLKIEKSCKISNLKVALKGSGNISIQGIESSAMFANLGGSGDIELKGTTQDATLELRNSGRINAEKLVSQNVAATIKGSGDIHCHAISKLKASVSGSGEIGYKGNPNIEQINTKSNKIRKL